MRGLTHATPTRRLTDAPLTRQLDELAAFEPDGFPVVSLYLDARTDRRGRDNFDGFVRKEFAARARSFAPDTPARASFESDAARIRLYLRDELRRPAGGLAVFACDGAGHYFKAVWFDAPINRHRLHVAERPHLYPLARLIDQYPRYVALVADTHSARLFAFGLGRAPGGEEAGGVEVSRTQAGGWSQMRYQRHVKNYPLHHAGEVFEALERVVREEGAEHVVLAGDEVIIPLLRERLPPRLAGKVIDLPRVDMGTPERGALKATLEALREQDTRTDAERVGRLLDQYRAGGLAVVGLRDALTALYRGQVDELLLSASAREMRCDDAELEGTPAEDAPHDQLDLREREPHLVAAGMLVARASDRGRRHLRRGRGVARRRGRRRRAPQIPSLKPTQTAAG